MKFRTKPYSTHSSSCLGALRHISSFTFSVSFTLLNNVILLLSCLEFSRDIRSIYFTHPRWRHCPVLEGRMSLKFTCHALIVGWTNINPWASGTVIERSIMSFLDLTSITLVSTKTALSVCSNTSFLRVSRLFTYWKVSFTLNWHLLLEAKAPLHPSIWARIRTISLIESWQIRPTSQTHPFF